MRRALNKRSSSAVVGFGVATGLSRSVIAPSGRALSSKGSLLVGRLGQYSGSQATTRCIPRITRTSKTSSTSRLSAFRFFATSSGAEHLRRNKWLWGAIIGGTLSGGVAFFYYNGSPFIVLAEDNKAEKPHLVILGSGWGAMSLVNELDTSNYHVTIVSPRNYFLFTPLLPSVSSGTLEPKTIIEPIRKYCKRTHSEVIYYEAACTDIDPVNKVLSCTVSTPGADSKKRDFKVTYDKLVIAVGAVNNTFGTPGVYENCLFLKELEDGIKIRNKLLDCLELASVPTQTEEDKRKLLSFVVVGGGPTGVEMAGECVDFINDNVEKWFPKLKPYVKITLLELLDHILSTYDKNISDYSEKHLKREKIDIRTLSRVVEVTENAVHIKRTDTGADETIPFGVCVWSTGIGTAPLVNSFRAKLDPALQTNRRALVTDSYLRVKGADGVYALGDCATISQEPMLNRFKLLFQEADVNGDGVLSFEEFDKMIQAKSRHYPQLELYGKKAREMFEEADLNKDGVLQLNEFETLLKNVDSRLKQLPATAQVASQEGKYLGTLFNKLAAQGTKEADVTKVAGLQPFRYRHLGSFAYVGSHSAVAEFTGQYTLQGFGAWWLWRSIYLSKQYSFQNKVLVGMNWLKTAIFGRDITRN